MQSNGPLPQVYCFVTFLIRYCTYPQRWPTPYNRTPDAQLPHVARWYSCHPLKFASVQRFWARSIQHLVYKECNLVDTEVSKSFFNSIVFPCLGAPGCFVVVFSISFVPDHDHAWWTLFCSALPEMTGLVTFCFTYSHEQKDLIEWYAEVARDDLFSDKLENLIIRPKESESGWVCHSHILHLLSNW